MDPKRQNSREILLTCVKCFKICLQTHQHPKEYRVIPLLECGSEKVRETLTPIYFAGKIHG